MFVDFTCLMFLIVSTINGLRKGIMLQQFSWYTRRLASTLQRMTEKPENGVHPWMASWPNFLHETARTVVLRMEGRRSADTKWRCMAVGEAQYRWQALSVCKLVLWWVAGARLGKRGTMECVRDKKTQRGIPGGIPDETRMMNKYEESS